MKDNLETGSSPMVMKLMINSKLEAYASMMSTSDSVVWFSQGGIDLDVIINSGFSYE